jgi:predicted alpha/beta superfamily hydrolase
VGGQPAGQGRQSAAALTGTIESKVLGEQRRYSVWLPDGYAASQERYPVLFLLDGPRHFGYATGMVDYLSRYAEAIVPAVVVDIEQQHRGRDMTPTPDKQNPGNSGGADRFLEFLSKELVPHIQSSYRTKAPMVLWGYSLSGLFAFHALLAKPELFGGYILASPAIWWDDSLLVHRAGAFFKRRSLEGKMFFAVGASERQEVRDYFGEMTRILHESAPKGFAATLRKFEGEEHDSICIPTTYYGLKAVFPK